MPSPPQLTMGHAFHELPRIVFGDDCPECNQRAALGLDAVRHLDGTNAYALGRLADELDRGVTFTGTPSAADLVVAEALVEARRLLLWVGMVEKRHPGPDLPLP